MNRRQLIALVGGAAAAWPLVARAQEPAMPMVGSLCSATPEGYASVLALIRQGLSEAGYVEGKNLAIEYRWANEQYDQLPELAADLVRREVAVILTTGGPAAARAAKTATAAIPIVFAVGNDPVQSGLVSKLSGSDSNITGVTFFNTALMPKRLEVIREAVPKASVFAMLMNSKNPLFELDKKDIQAAAAASGVQLFIVYAAGEGDPETAFQEIVQKRVDALLVHPDAVLYSRIRQIIALAAHHSVPTMYFNRECAELGGLFSYGSDTSYVLRQAGIYVGRILKGEKPGDLPVQQPTKFELVINLKTAKAIGLTVPPTLLARADEVIE